MFPYCYIGLIVMRRHHRIDFYNPTLCLKFQNLNYRSIGKNHISKCFQDKIQDLKNLSWLDSSSLIVHYHHLSNKLSYNPIFGLIGKEKWKYGKELYTLNKNIFEKSICIIYLKKVRCLSFIVAINEINMKGMLWNLK